MIDFNLRIDLKSFFLSVVRQHDQKHPNNHHKWDLANNTSSTLFANPSMHLCTSIKHTIHKHTHDSWIKRMHFTHTEMLVKTDLIFLGRMTAWSKKRFQGIISIFQIYLPQKSIKSYLHWALARERMPVNCTLYGSPIILTFD